MLLTELNNPLRMFPLLSEVKDVKVSQFLLTISRPNRGKLAKIGAYSLDLLAGATCPGAALCFAQMVEVPGKTGVGTPKTKIIEVPPGVDPEKWKAKYNITQDTKFRCYAATMERIPSVYMAHKTNSEALKSAGSAEKMADLICDSIEHAVPKGHRSYFRIHASGDFFNETYLKAWIEVAKRMPRTIFYTYTKFIPAVLKHEKQMPDNLHISLSMGSKWDDKTIEYAKRPQNKRRFKVAHVVFSKEEAAERGLQIDTTDELAAESDKDFAILLHGAQPAGSRASKVWQKELVRRRDLQDEDEESVEVV